MSTISTLSETVVPVIKSMVQTGRDLAKDPEVRSIMMVGVGVLTGFAASYMGKKVGQKINDKISCGITKVNKKLPKITQIPKPSSRVLRATCSIGAQIGIITAAGYFGGSYYGKEIVSGMMISSVIRAECESVETPKRAKKVAGMD